MRMYKSLLLLSIVFLFSCSNKDGNISNFLSQSSLPAQLFSVNIDADTTLVTASGCIINLPKGTLQSSTDNIKLEIKEALNTTDIVMAGLTTMSGTQALSSGGMIYINAAQGYQVEIKKQVEILVPSKNYNPAMQVFKGVKKGNETIDWTKPTALPEDETLIKIANGEKFFKANCASCHKIDKDFTGPLLRGVTDRRPKQWLYAFTRNPAKLMTEGYYNEGSKDIPITDSTIDQIIPDFYSACLQHKWWPTIMTSFPQLTDSDLDALYAYIKIESDKYPKPVGANYEDCCDSCDTYGKAMYAITKEFRKFEKPAESLFNLDRTVPVPSTIDTTTTQAINTMAPAAASPDMRSFVSTNHVKATFYTINIKAFGWYNIDILMKDISSCTPSELFVRIQGSYSIDVNVVLVIPSVKAFVEGGKLDDGKQYGFDETNGKIPLPLNAKCYVMAFGEYKNKIIFGRSTFSATEKQTIDIVLRETTKEIMSAEIKEMNLDDVSLEIKTVTSAAGKVDNPAKIRNEAEFNKKMEEATKLRPTGCACGFER